MQPKRVARKFWVAYQDSNQKKVLWSWFWVPAISLCACSVNVQEKTNKTPSAEVQGVRREGVVGAKVLIYRAGGENDIILRVPKKLSIKETQEGQGILEKYQLVDLTLRLQDGKPLLGFLPLRVGETYEQITVAVPKKIEHQQALEDFLRPAYPRLVLTQVTLSRHSFVDIPPEAGGGRLPILLSVSYRSEDSAVGEKDKTYPFR